MKTSEITLLYLLKHPHSELHIRGLGRELGIAPQITSRNLKQLEGQGLVVTKLLGAQKMVHFAFSEKSKSLAAYLLEREKEEAASELQPIISRLNKLNSKIVILFGSSLKNVAEANDIDILVIDNELNATRIDTQTTQLSLELPKPVVPLLLETKDVPKQYNKLVIQKALAGIVVKGAKEYVELMEVL
ncbi:hypothetical protein HZC30_05590 [Candidatus Woesearchaeota archaeon]|nr:hypothetical protein [Candidatus Woesearchaeota archaeon]